MMTHLTNDGQTIMSSDTVVHLDILSVKQTVNCSNKSNLKEFE